MVNFVQFLITWLGGHNSVRVDRFALKHVYHVTSLGGLLK